MTSEHGISHCLGNAELPENRLEEEFMEPNKRGKNPRGNPAIVEAGIATRFQAWSQREPGRQTSQNALRGRTSPCRGTFGSGIAGDPRAIQYRSESRRPWRAGP